jgi:uncharacterized membrane protein
MSDMTTASQSRFQLSPRSRKAVLLLHVVSAVGWLGLHLGNVTFAVTGLVTDDPVTQRTAFRAVDLLGGMLLIPISLVAFSTGVLLALGTRWGLVRYWWVMTKFVLTLIPVILIPLSLLPGYRELAGLVNEAPADQVVDVGTLGPSLVVAAIVSTSMYLTSVTLSVFKPWGRTKWGKRRPAGPARVAAAA